MLNKIWDGNFKYIIMIVKIIKATKSTYWYADRIGEVFQVKSKGDDKNSYTVVTNGSPGIYLIKKDDCKLCE